MKDIEARQVVLKYLYDNRRNEAIEINPRKKSSIEGLDCSLVRAAAEQLDDIGHVKYEKTINGGYLSISTAGIEEIENEGEGAVGMVGIAPVTVNKNTTNITTSSQGDALVSVEGDATKNIDTTMISIDELIQKIDGADATSDERVEAKTLLKALKDNLLISGIISGGVSGLVAAAATVI